MGYVFNVPAQTLWGTVLTVPAQSPLYRPSTSSTIEKSSASVSEPCNCLACPKIRSIALLPDGIART